LFNVLFLPAARLRRDKSGEQLASFAARPGGPQRPQNPVRHHRAAQSGRARLGALTMNTVSKLKRTEPAPPQASRSRHGPERGKTVLVAGGAGFLGARLCARYIEAGCRVVCLDNLSTGRLGNLAALMDEPNFTFVFHDVVDPVSSRIRFDLIYNMACPASPPKYQADPIQPMKTCLYGAYNLLGLARDPGARILQASPSEGYGNPDVSPQREVYQGNVNTVGPRSCYDEGKRAAETIFHDFQDCYGTDIRIARIFNAYGPGMDPGDGRVVSNFINQALAGEPITIFGDGSQTRSFCYLEDMVDGLIGLMHCPGAGHEPVNIGNPDAFSIAELARLVLQKIPSGSKVSYRDLPQDDPKQRRPDISRARRLLAWQPRVQLAQGLDKTIAYFRAEAEAQPLAAALAAK
jgi:UDP-glucuronate decarboxylase